MDEVTIKKIMRNMEAFYASEFKSNYIKAEPIVRNLMDDGMSEKEERDFMATVMNMVSLPSQSHYFLGPKVCTKKHLSGLNG